MSYMTKTIRRLEKEVSNLKTEIKKLRGQIDITAIRARHFANDKRDVGMNHQASRWTSIADAHEETLAHRTKPKERKKDGNQE